MNRLKIISVSTIICYNETKQLGILEIIIFNNHILRPNNQWSRYSPNFIITLLKLGGLTRVSQEKLVSLTNDNC